MYLEGAGVVAVPPDVADTDSGVLIAGAVQGTLGVAARGGKRRLCFLKMKRIKSS